MLQCGPTTIPATPCSRTETFSPSPEAPADVPGDSKWRAAEEENRRATPGRLPPQLRRRDKSTAIGRGACGWLDWVFLSAPAHALLPLDVKILRKSTVTAPSYLPKPADGPP